MKKSSKIKTGRSASRKPQIPKPIEKRYNKAGTNCKVTFRLPGDATRDVNSVNLAGEFNNWSTENTPMTRLKSGEFKVTLDLEPGREYRFRFLLDGVRWENHWNADKYVKNRYGTEDSVVIL